MTAGLRLNASDYSIAADNGTRAAYNTFNLVDSTMSVAATYQPNQNNVSIQWNNLLEAGRGPEAGPDQLARFEQAKKVLYKVYDTERSAYYDDYIKKQREFLIAELDLKDKMKKDYGDQWEISYKERLPTLPHYYELQQEKEKIELYESDIDEWNYGPYASTIKSMKQNYKDSKMHANIPGVGLKDFLFVEMTPSNWYQWFDEKQPSHDGWTEITVTKKSSFTGQNSNYTKVGGSGKKRGFFLTVTAKATGKTVSEYTDAESEDIQISFKVRAVQISRKWIDLSALRLEKFTIPGLTTGAWSTGELSYDNKGFFPLLSTQMIVAKDVTVSASKFSQSVSDTLKTFDIKTNVATFFGMIQLGGASVSSTERNYTFQQSSSGSSITLHSTEVIGYACTVVPPFPN